MSIIKRLYEKYGTRESRVKGDYRKVLDFLKSLANAVPAPTESLRVRAESGSGQRE